MPRNSACFCVWLLIMLQQYGVVLLLSLSVREPAAFCVAAVLLLLL